jgi:hypothetical protein
MTTNRAGLIDQYILPRVIEKIEKRKRKGCCTEQGGNKEPHAVVILKCGNIECVCHRILLGGAVRT